MGANTKIQWAHHTFNPWIGCQRVSPGCEHCYAEAMAKRAPQLVHGFDHRLAHGEPGALAKGLPVWGPQAPRRVTSTEYWRQPLRWNRQAQEAGERRRVFCASMADVFETDRPLGHGAQGLDDIRAHLWVLIKSTPSLDWLLLTKRPENVLGMVPPDWLATGALRGGGWPHNAWIGTTAEDQKRADERIPHLLKVPAAVRFVSYEPALSAVDFRPWLPVCQCGRPCPVRRGDGLFVECERRRVEMGHDSLPRGIDWLIVGGESGPGARPFDLAWARQTVAQCAAAQVPCFVKQMGAVPVSRALDDRFPDGEGRISALPIELKLRDPKGGDMDEWSADLRVRQVPGESR